MPIDLVERYGARNYSPLPVVLTRGEGVWVWDDNGQRYLDMLSAYSALNQGHRHPRIIAAAKAQMDRLTVTSRAFHNDQLGPFLSRLAEVSGFPKVLPMNSGAEAVETALKAIRKWAYQVKGVPVDTAEIIVAQNNFHGRTISIVSFSTEEQYKLGFGPFTPGFVHVPFGDVDAIARAITPRTAAVLLEPIQGEGGVIVPPPGYLSQVRDLCDANRVLMVLDEIQTGLGRTGKMWCYQHEGIVPDAITVGKALGGGVYPVSALCATAEVMDVFTPGDHGSTFGGNALAAAIGRAALDVLVDEELPARAATEGAYFIDRLREIAGDKVKDIRGKGLLVGMELHTEAKPLVKALKTRGLLCKETHHTTIRFAPPLIVTREELDFALGIIEEVFSSPA